MTDKGTCITTRNLHRRFGDLQVLRGVDLDIPIGSIVTLYGPSGSGKTTLLNLIGALDRPQEGSVSVMGQDILRMNENQRAKLRRTQIGFIFQSATLLPTYTALENIDLALRLPKLGYRERKRRANAALQAVGLSAWSDHRPEELSGGQRQRVAIARALALRARVILADEPTSGLDTTTSQRILALLRAIAAAEDTTFLLVTHDPMLANYADHVYDLSDGKLIARENHTPIVDMEPQPQDKPTTGEIIYETP